MAQIGDGISSDAIEQNVDIAAIQARIQGAQAAIAQVSLPATGFVAALNGESGSITIQPGTSTTGITVNVTNGVGTISIGVAIPVLLTLGALATVKCNTAAVAPAVTDDSASGYARFSMWIDTVLQDAYICIVATVGAAIWKKITP